MYLKRFWSRCGKFPFRSHCVEQDVCFKVIKGIDRQKLSRMYIIFTWWFVNNCFVRDFVHSVLSPEK